MVQSLLITKGYCNIQQVFTKLNWFVGLEIGMNFTISSYCFVFYWTCNNNKKWAGVLKQKIKRYKDIKHVKYKK